MALTTNILEKTRAEADLQIHPKIWRQHTQWQQLKKNKKMFLWPWTYETWANSKIIIHLNHLINTRTIRLFMPKLNATNTICLLNDFCIPSKAQVYRIWFQIKSYKFRWFKFYSRLIRYQLIDKFVRNGITN